MPLGPGVPRFLRLTDVAEILNISTTQARALVLREDLPAVKVGGRGIWRVEAAQLEAYIERLYAERKKDHIDGHPVDAQPVDSVPEDAKADADDDES